MKRGLQKFSKKYLDQSIKLKPEEILDFIENFKIIYFKDQKDETILISMKIKKS